MPAIELIYKNIFVSTNINPALRNIEIGNVVIQA
jgi:hypothetical protein